MKLFCRKGKKCARGRKETIMQSNERESSFQRKSKVSPLPPFSLAIKRFWRSANSGGLTITRVHEPKSPTKYPVVIAVGVEGVRNLYGKLRSPWARCEKTESRSPQLSFIAARQLQGASRLIRPSRKGLTLPNRGLRKYPSPLIS